MPNSTAHKTITKEAPQNGILTYTFLIVRHEKAPNYVMSPTEECYASVCNPM